MELRERFERHVDRTETCWLWTGKLSDWGYGKISFGRNNPSRTTHRVAYELYVGPIPEGAVVCHRCDTPRCVRPDHLFLGSVADNNTDMLRKGRHGYASRDTCKNGHPLSGDNITMKKGARICRTCARKYGIESWRRRKARGELLER